MKGKYNDVKHPKEFSARTQVMHLTYFHIAEFEYEQCLLIRNQDKTHFNEIEFSELESKATQHAIKAIVFAAMSVEAAINNYAGTHLDDKYFETHLSSLDVVSKWIIIPRFVCGYSLDKSSSAFSALKQLIKSRNQLVHSKSRDLNPHEPLFMEKIERSEQKFNHDFINSLKALYLLAMEMDYVTGQRYNPLGTLDPKFCGPNERSELLKPLFTECKNIVLKNHS